jgi:hypothetical protein
VNVGIILALAGVDFSQVREPDYEPARIRQSTDVTRYIENLAGRVLEHWENCVQIGHRKPSRDKYAERDRTIFYDTDNILEAQREKIHVCPDCSGVLGIDSRSDSGYHIYAVHVPRKACQECHELGYRWFEAASGRTYGRIYLQDRARRQYLCRKV